MPFILVENETLWVRALRRPDRIAYSEVVGFLVARGRTYSRRASISRSLLLPCSLFHPWARRRSCVIRHSVLCVPEDSRSGMNCSCSSYFLIEHVSGARVILRGSALLASFTAAPSDRGGFVDGTLGWHRRRKARAKGRTELRMMRNFQRLFPING